MDGLYGFLAWKYTFYSFLTHFSKGNEFLPQTLTVSPYILATRCRRPLTFQTNNSVRSNSLSLKYHRFTPSGFEDIEIRKFEFVAKTQFLLPENVAPFKGWWTRSLVNFLMCCLCQGHPHHQSWYRISPLPCSQSSQGFPQCLTCRVWLVSSSTPGVTRPLEPS